MIDMLIGARQLARAKGVSRRAATNALRCGKLNGHQIDVVEMPGRGGRNGRVLMVRVSSLPAELQERLGAVQGPVNDPFQATAPVALSDFEPLVSAGDTRARLALIEPMLATEPGTSERAAAIAAAAAKGRVSEAALRRWLTRYEQLGMVGLARKRRADAGGRRAIAWLAIDERLRASGRTDQESAAFAERVRGHVRGLLASTSASSAMVAQACIGFVAQRLRDAGASVSQGDLIAVCRPSAEFVRAERQALVDVHRNDAGRFAAKHEPRIRRDRSHLLPMEVVCGDVAHLDVLIRRADGSTATPKAVAFQCLATNRLFYRLYLLAKGEGIRREHVLETFCAMCADPRWGVPSRLQLDNGSEFKALDLAQGLFELKVATEEVGSAEPGVGRARPYNAPAKPIEGIFSILNAKLLPMLPGFIGGNRLVEKTETQGRPPTPYPGTPEQLERDVETLIALYHDKPQSLRSHLAGQSPNQRLREHLEAGWQPAVLRPDRLGAVFCTRHKRRVSAGGCFKHLGRVWRHDDPMVRERVIVHEPLFGDRGRLFVFDERDRELLCVAEPNRLYAFDDPAGAREQARQKALLNRKIRRIAAQADPVDPMLAAAATAAEFGYEPLIPTLRCFDSPWL